MKKNEPVEIVGLREDKLNTVVTDIEMFHKLLDYAEAGDNIGALLRGIDKKSIERGQVLAKPGSIHPLTKFKGPGLRPVQGRRRPSHRLLQQLPSPVLLPDHRRDRHHHPA